MTRSDGTWFVLSLEGDRFIALHAKATAGATPRVKVLACLSKTIPAGIDLTNAADIGAWIGRELKDAGLDRAARRDRVVFAIPRSEVMLKRVAFPPGTARADRPEIVRLQMVRQLTVSPESAVIDFADSMSGLERSAKAGAVSTITETVLAGALQLERLEWRRAVASAAGMRVASMSLKASGAAMIVSDAVSVKGGQSGGGGAMGITLGCGATEFVIVENGQLVFARGSDLVRPDPLSGSLADDEAFADKVAVEAKRTWMSYRSTPDSIEVDSIFVLGGDRGAELISQRCKESMESRTEIAPRPSFIEFDDAVRPESVVDVMPLAGLIAEGLLGRPTLDFANPTQPPDVGAARRQRLLLGALAAILALGSAYTFTRLDLKNREDKLNQVTQEWADQSTKYADFVRLKARVAHVKEWREARFDWLAHVGFLNEQLPSTKQAILEGISARGEEDIVYAKAAGANNYSPAAWSSRLRGTFLIQGKVKRREIADELRLSMVDDKRYTLDSKGADTADSFDWRLVTTRAKPDDDTDKSATTAAPGTSDKKDPAKPAPKSAPAKPPVKKDAAPAKPAASPPAETPAKDAKKKEVVK